MRAVHKIGPRGILAIAFGAAGVFLMVRLKAFLLQAFALELPVWTLGAGVLLLALATAVFAGPVSGFLRQWTWRSPVLSGVVYGLSILAVYPMRGLLIGRALEDSGVGMSALTRCIYLLGGGILLGVFLMGTITAVRDLLPRLKRFCKRIERGDILFLLAVLLLANLVVRIYAVNSSTIYYWDNAGYWSTSHQLAQQWQTEGFMSLLRTVYDSILTEDYNDLIALPATVFTRLFGESRYVFLAAIVNFGYYPICVLVWALAKRLGKRPKLVAAGTILALPMLMSNVLNGFVDVGGCIFTLAALLLWYVDGGRNDFGRFLLVGVCLAAAVLLRRWYSFYALAFVLALMVDCLFFRRSAVPLLGALSSFAFMLLFLFQTLVSQRLLADYGTLYEAYSLGLDRDFLLLFYYYGAVMLGLSLIVDIYLIWKRQSRSVGVFLLVQTVLCFALFVRIQTHGQQHLLLYTPVQIVLFAVGLNKLQTLRREGAIALSLVVALTPSLSPFLPRQKVESIQELHALEPLPAFSWYPPQREDADEIVALIRRMDEFGEEGKTVGLLASSFVLNRDILVNAEASLSLARISDISRSDYFFALPQVDQRDGWWDTLFYCDVLVVADPVQLHLGEENQAVVNLPAQALLLGTGFAAAYEKLEESFTLDNGIQVYFYEKVQEPSQEEQDQLRDAFFALHPDATYNGE